MSRGKHRLKAMSQRVAVESEMVQSLRDQLSAERSRADAAESALNASSQERIDELAADLARVIADRDDLRRQLQQEVNPRRAAAVDTVVEWIVEFLNSDGSAPAKVYAAIGDLGYARDIDGPRRLRRATSKTLGRAHNINAHGLDLRQGSF